MNPLGMALGLLMAASASAEVAEFEPGESLQRALPAALPTELRFGLNGAPPGAVGTLPGAPDRPGAYWLVGYDREGRVHSWHRFRVRAPAGLSADNGSQAESIPIELLLDRQAPQARLLVEGPQVEREERRVLAADARITVDASDPSGGVRWTLQVNGEALESPEIWSQGLAEGAVRLAVDTVDALGNRALRAPVEVWLDRSPPELSWQRLDVAADAPADVFDGRRARLRLHATDALAGVALLQVGGRSLNVAQAGAEGVELRVDASSLDYVLEDAVGNRSEGRLPLRVDREGPELQSFIDDRRVEIEGLQMTRTQQLRLRAVDATAGVAHACVEASVWYRECRELPMDLVGLSAGRYTLDFRAVDTLGNRSSRRFKVEVLR